MKMRAFWIGFGILPTILGDADAWGLSIGYLISEDLGIPRETGAYIHQFLEDAARCSVGVAAHWGYVRARKTTQSGTG